MAENLREVADHSVLDRDTIIATALSEAERALATSFNRIGELEAEVMQLREDKTAHYITDEENKRLKLLLTQYRVDLNATRRFMREEYERAELYTRAFNQLYNKLNWYGRVGVMLASLLFWKNFSQA